MQTKKQNASDLCIMVLQKLAGSGCSKRYIRKIPKALGRSILHLAEENNKYEKKKQYKILHYCRVSAFPFFFFFFYRKHSVLFA